MATAPGLKSIDPIQGLVEFVQEYKPFHSKIFEVLFEYIYTDRVVTTVKDTMTWVIDENQVFYTSTTDPALAGPVTAGSFWYDPVAMILYIRNTANTAWITYLTKLAKNPDTGSNIDTSITEFMETIAFDWTGNYSYPIVGVTPTQIILGGNHTNAFKLEDLTEITGTDNNGPHTIVGFSYDPMSDQTYVELDNVPTSLLPGPPVFTVQDVDITFWYQFPIINVVTTPTAPSRTVSFAGVEFCWGGTPGSNEPAICAGTNKFVVPGGDFTSIFGAGVIAFMEGTSTTNDGTYQVVTSTYVPRPLTDPFYPDSGSTLVTVVPFGTNPGTLPFVNSTQGTVSVDSPNTLARQSTNAIIQSIQGSIVVPGVPYITVAGNATTSVQVGAEFQIQGSGTNDGLYHAVYVQYEPIADTTTIGVATTTGVTMLPVLASGGGLVVPYRFIGEVHTGSYDNSGFDVGPFDQSAGSIIHQGP